MAEQVQNLKEQGEKVRASICGSERVLIGIGSEWGLTPSRADALREAYGRLLELVEDKDYFVVTTVTDGTIYDMGFDPQRVVAPCGNVHWFQCSQACTKDIWEEGEAPGGICPHCGNPLIPNTIEAKQYIEEGYLPQWRTYTAWLAQTLNRTLTVLELGEGFETPTVMRWPFEKTVFLNRKACMYRVHATLPQISGELKGKAWGILCNSVDFCVVSFGSL